MAKYQWTGLEEYAEKLAKLGDNAEKVCRTAVYEMAKVVADQVKENIKALPSVPDSENIKAWKKGEKARLTAGQKKGLIESFGISSMQNRNGYIHVKLGFDGYNDVRTNSYPDGQPNAMIARSCESGGSYMDKIPFVRPAVRQTKDEAVRRARATIDESIDTETETKV